MISVVPCHMLETMDLDLALVSIVSRISPASRSMALGPQGASSVKEEAVFGQLSLATSVVIGQTSGVVFVVMHSEA